MAGVVVMGAVLTPVGSGRPLRALLLERLMDAGTWVEPVPLCQGLTTCQMALEDALADLVVDGKVVFRLAVGYRLAGGPEVRRAAQLMRRARSSRGAFMREVVRKGADGQGRQAFALGMVWDRPDVGLVQFEVDLPAVGLDGQLAYAQRVVDFMGAK